MNSSKLLCAIALIAQAVSLTAPALAVTPSKPAAKAPAKPAVKRTAVPVKRAGARPAVKAGVRPGPRAASIKPAPHAAGELVWNSVTNGFALAKKSKKPMIVDFYTDWCGWCKVMDREVYGNAAIKKVLAAQFVMVKANAEDGADGQKLSQICEVNGFPTTLFFDASQKPKTMIIGYVKPENFQEKLQEFLTGKPPASKQAEKPEEKAPAHHVPVDNSGAQPGTQVEVTSPTDPEKPAAH